MADKTPRLRIDPDNGAGGPPMPKAARRRTPPRNLYQPDYPCREKDCPDCSATPRRTCRQKKVSKTWWCRFSVDGVRKPISTGCTDLRNAELKAAQIRLDLERRANGIVSGKRLRVRDTLAKFDTYLRTGQGKKRHYDDEKRILAEALGEWGSRFIDELDTEVYSDWLRARADDDLRHETKNERIAILQRYGTWLLGARLLPYDPFALLTKLNPDADPGKRKRRALWPLECEALLKEALTRPIRDARAHRVLKGVTKSEMIKLRRQGRVRALIYRTVSQTGLRRNEVTNVRVRDVDFSAGKIWLNRSLAKAKRDQHVFLNSDLARRLAAYIRSLGPVDPHTRLFDIGGDSKRAAWTAVPSVETLYRDMKAAGVPLKDARDRVADFHALRMTYITHLRMAGVGIDLARSLARHSDMKLTDEIYTDHDLLPEREAAEMLVPERRRQKFVPRLR